MCSQVCLRFNLLCKSFSITIDDHIIISRSKRICTMYVTMYEVVSRDIWLRLCSYQTFTSKHAYIGAWYIWIFRQSHGNLSNSLNISNIKPHTYANRILSSCRFKWKIEMHKVRSQNVQSHRIFDITHFLLNINVITRSDYPSLLVCLVF